MSYLPELGSKICPNWGVNCPPPPIPYAYVHKAGELCSHHQPWIRDTERSECNDYVLFHVVCIKLAHDWNCCDCFFILKDFMFELMLIQRSIATIVNANSGIPVGLSVSESAFILVLHFVTDSIACTSHGRCTLPASVRSSYVSDSSFAGLVRSRSPRDWHSSGISTCLCSWTRGW